MSLPVFFSDTCSADAAVGNHVCLDGDEGHHAVTVMRLAEGDELIIADGQGSGLRCVVRCVDSPRKLTAEVLEPRVVSSTGPITVVQAIPKSDRADTAVDLVTQAGATTIMPWAASRCIAKWVGPKAGKALKKWRSVATAAAKQSRRLTVPEITEVVSTSHLVNQIRQVTADGGVAVVCDENATTTLAALRPLAEAGAQAPLLFVIGPEGGLTDEEVARLADAGAHPVVLGEQILRTVTAGFAAIVAASILTGRW